MPSASGPAALFLERLRGVAPQQNGGWAACCPAHEDDNASLTVGIGEQGQVVFKCWAGCEAGDVMAAIGLAWRQLYPESNGNGDRQHTRRRQVATYDYRTPDGILVFQVVRWEPKGFSQRRPNGEGGWIWNLTGVRRVLYHAADLTHPRLFLVEGEKDVERLRALGLPATTCSQGAGKWRPAYTNQLRAAAPGEVVILPDNDEAGRNHATAVANELAAAGINARIVHLPVFDKGDVSDFLANHPVAELLDLVERTEPHDLPPPPVPDDDGRPLIAMPGLIDELLDASWSAVQASNTDNCRPVYFRRGTESGRELVRIREEPTVMGTRAWTAELGRISIWVKEKAKGGPDPIFPPERVVAAMTADPDPGLPNLTLVRRAPMVLADGALLPAGYDPTSGVLVLGAPEVEVDPSPTQTDAQQAAEDFTEDVIGDFPFASEADQTHALAAFLFCHVRHLFDGVSPIHMVEATKEGTGKSLFCNVIGRVTTAEQTHHVAMTNDSDEIEKRIAVAVRSCRSEIILLDNLTVRLDSGAIAASVTAETWRGRVLGRSQEISVPNRFLWLLSGNNVRLSAELVRRTVRIRMEAPCANPGKRGGFRHPYLLRHVRNHRAQLLRHLLTWVRAWVLAGMPLGTQLKGSFEEWAATIGGLLAFAGRQGFLQTDADQALAIDVEDEVAAFVQAWFDTHYFAAAVPVATAADLLPFVQQHSLFEAARARSSNDRSETLAVSNRLARSEGRVFDVEAPDTTRMSVRLRAEYDRRQRRKTFTLEAVT